ncbi:NAD-dependent epimerase/dehydratase family protein [Demequina lutea]|uniref:Nucleoside-diphosphate-sugar epimerase n=1 Tax=Demequina lutea TaxID=431489 RepID=A0A7Y9ZBR1_9MICO|nr:NAD(P)-dependent oxidoreductase [Demequina lutea]NYI42444.1 nucleoside-diphosphate-sugar epimerase [Demequina lutea]
MTQLTHAVARDLWSRSLDADDRVLVLGASGWFGRTAVALLADVRCPTFFIASTSKQIMVGGVQALCEPWDERAVRAFAPTVVLDFAFLTRDVVATMPLADYVAANEALTSKLLAAAGLPSVRRIVTISSGAAVYPDDALLHPMDANPYGWLKRHAEDALAELAESRSLCAVVARAWSVSGAFVQKPASYALSDMITQANRGAIHIRATRPVYRRYVSVEDLLAVALASATTPGVLTIDSGGPLLEMGELAHVVARVVNPSATITRAEPDGSDPDRYYAASESWNGACRASGHTPNDIEGQVTIAAAGLRGR